MKDEILKILTKSELFTIVDNIKDDVVYFNSNSEQSGYTNQVDPEKQDKTIDRMARKQTKKELNK